MSKMFKAVFPDRLAASKINGLPLNYMSPIVVQEQQTSMMVMATDKRDAWNKVKQMFPFERIIIER